MKYREIRSIPVTETYSLRSQYLDISSPMNELDSEPLALHLGAFEDGNLVGVASLYKMTLPDDPAQTESWCIWGLIVKQKFAEQGYKTRLLEACIGYSAYNNGDLIWHKSDGIESTFYEDHGFIHQKDPLNPGESDAYILMLRRLYPDDKKMQVNGVF